MADRTNFSELAGDFAREWGAVIRAAQEVVQDHVRDCQAAALMAEAKVRKRAAETHGGIGEAWRYFASPAILDLARALLALQGGPREPVRTAPANRPLP
jgi:hypothetical protein